MTASIKKNKIIFYSIGDCNQGDCNAHKNVHKNVRKDAFLGFDFIFYKQNSSIAYVICLGSPLNHLRYI